VGRGRRARSRRSRKKRAASIRGRRLELCFEELEVARAHDGPLRGRVEPRLVVGAYHVRSGRAVLVGRALGAVDVPSQVPCRVAVGRELIRAAAIASSSADDGSFVVLVLALEEDSGRDVRELYAELERCASWTVWDERGVVPEPRALAELATLGPSEPPAAERVQLLFGEHHVPASPKDDELVGALLVRVPASPPQAVDWRFRFESPDGKNDWTATLRIRVAGAA
jgi:hypothetical protein